MKSNPLDALQAAHRLKGFWPVTLVLVALVAGVYLPTLVNRLAQLVLNAMSGIPFIGSFAAGMSQDVALPANAWFGLFFYAAMSVAVAFVLRCVALHLLFRLRGRTPAFGTSATILALAHTGTILLTALVVLLILIPADALTQLVLALGALAATIWFGISELLIYIGINRVGRFEKSALVPHVLLSTAVVLVMALLHWMVISSMVDSAGSGF